MQRWKYLSDAIFVSAKSTSSFLRLGTISTWINMYEANKHENVESWMWIMESSEACAFQQK